MRWTLLAAIGLVLLLSAPQSSFAKPAPKPQEGEGEEVVEVIEEASGANAAAAGENAVPVEEDKPKPDELDAAPAATPPVEDSLEKPPTAPEAPSATAAAAKSGAAGAGASEDGDCDAACMLSHQTPLILFACILVSILLLLVILLGCYFMRKLHGRAILTTNQRIPTSTLKPGDVVQRKTTETKQVVGAGKNEQRIVTTTTTKVVSSGGATAGEQ